MIEYISDLYYYYIPVVRGEVEHEPIKPYMSTISLYSYLQGFIEEDTLFYGFQPPGRLITG